MKPWVRVRRTYDSVTIKIAYPNGAGYSVSGPIGTSDSALAWAVDSIVGDPVVRRDIDFGIITRAFVDGASHVLVIESTGAHPARRLA